MFALTVIDHVRLNSEQSAQNYTVHARAAERLARFALTVRIAVLAFITIAAGTATVSAIVPDRPVHIAAAIAALLALASYAAYLTVGIEARVLAHRAFAHRLWLLAERHRSLLTEIEQGLIDPATALNRRDELIQQSHAAYEHGFAPDQVGHETARTARFETAASTAG